MSRGRTGKRWRRHGSGQSTSTCSAGVGLRCARPPTPVWLVARLTAAPRQPKRGLWLSRFRTGRKSWQRQRTIGSRAPRSSGATAGAVGTRGSADGGDAVCCALGTRRDPHTLGGFFEVARTRLRLTVEPSRRAAFGGFCLAKRKSFQLPCLRASQWTTIRVHDGLPNRMTQQLVGLRLRERRRSPLHRKADVFHFHKNCYGVFGAL